MLHPTGITLRILNAAITAHDGAAGRRVDDDDVRSMLEADYPAAVVREALCDLGADWLAVKPYQRDGKVTRVEVWGVERRPDVG